MKPIARLTLVGLLLAAAVPARAGEVKLSFSNGRVTIVATDASPRQIMGEWARLGQVKVTNLERLSGSPVSLQLTDVPEAQALETLLRGTAGYVAAPRQVAASTGSKYDRILLMPGSAPPPSAITTSAPSSMPSPMRGRQQVFQTVDPDDDDPPRPMPGPPNSAGRDGRRPGMPDSQPQGQSTVPGVIQRQPPTSYGSQPGFGQQPSTGASVPGMPTAPPQQQQSPYSNSGAGSTTVAPAIMSSTFPGQSTAAAAPGQSTADTTSTDTTGTSGSARPGEATTGPTAAQFKNPYGLPDPVNPPVTNPNVSPYGLTSPVRTPTTTGSTTPGATTTGATTPGSTTTGPIKHPEA